MKLGEQLSHKIPTGASKYHYYFLIFFVGYQANNGLIFFKDFE
jgi:uncharacterized membrane protein YbjE (DUF340 family)